jgi:hypothetical protein
MSYEVIHYCDTYTAGPKKSAEREIWECYQLLYIRQYYIMYKIRLAICILSCEKETVYYEEDTTKIIIDVSARRCELVLSCSMLLSASGFNQLPSCLES